MLQKDNHLKTKHDFDTVFKSGRSFHDACLSVRVVKNRLGLDRFGFVISTKVTKRAVQRNKVRRRLRAIVAKRLPDLRSGFDIVFLTRKGVVELSFKELELMVDHLLRKAGLV